jgi:hypothetical protein
LLLEAALELAGLAAGFALAFFAGTGLTIGLAVACTVIAGPAGFFTCELAGVFAGKVPVATTGLL